MGAFRERKQAFHARSVLFLFDLCYNRRRGDKFMNEVKKEKPKYNIWQNIRYALGNIWRWDKVYYLAFIPKIPISVFLPVAGVYFPKLLIELIERKTGDTEMLTTIGVYCLVLTAAGLINSRSAEP